jgi:hypothetical protein
MIKKINIRFLPLLVMLFITSVNGYSQGTDLSSGNKSRFFVGICVVPGKSTIQNNSSTTISNMKSNGKSFLSGGIEAGLMFSDYIGISTGIGYSSFQTGITLDSYATNYDTTDNTESYKRYITGENITEIQKISFLEIPLLLNLQIPLNTGFGFFLQTGVNFSIPVTKSYSSSGTFTYEGFYPVYNVSITGVPYEGFEQLYPTIDEGELNIKPFNLELIASGGIHINLQEKVQIALGVSYNKLMSDISGYRAQSTYRLSSKPNQMKSIMEAGGGANASSLGLRISLRYFLR